MRAWVTVETSPPTIEVYNEGDSPIFEVVPTPTLIAQDLEGRIVAMLGATAPTSSRAAQISPGRGYGWRLDHMAGSTRPLASSQLHVDSVDNAGRNWRLAHDRLTQLP